jgi:hypothetical protein
MTSPEVEASPWIPYTDDGDDLFKSYGQEILI